MGKIEAKTVLQRLKMACNFKMDKELAEAMNLAQASVSTWYKRDYVDLNLIAESFPDISLDYLVTGDGPKYRDLRKVDLERESKENEGVKMLVELLHQQLEQKDAMLANLNRQLASKDAQLQEAQSKMVELTSMTTDLIAKFCK